MKNLSKILCSVIVAFGMLVPAGVVFAYSPSLSVSASSYDNSQLSVTGGAPYSNVTLYYSPSGSSLYNSITNFGTTDGTGYFYTTISSSSYGITSGSRIYAVVGGDVTNTVNSYGNNSNNNCNYYNCSTNALNFSQTSISVNVGQTAFVTANYYSVLIYPQVNYLYIASNSNSNVATASIQGNTITILGNQNGSTTLNVCVSGSNQCGSVYVTVNGGYTSGNITFSQANPSLSAGSNVNISIYSTSAYGAGYYIYGNSNSNVVNATVSGSILYLSALSSGSSTVTVCQYGSSQCGYVYVSVGGSGSGNITFSQNNPSVTVGQSNTVYVYSSGNSGNFYVQNNSNSNIVSTSLTGSVLTLYGLSVGSASIVVCQYNTTGCATLYVTVSGSQTQLSLSQSSISLSAGQNMTVGVYGATGSLYVYNNSNSSVASASLSASNMLGVYGLSSGTTTITVCQNSNSQCIYLYVTVTGNSGNTNVWFSPTNPQVAVGQTQNVSIYNTGSYSATGYYVSSTSNPNVVTANINSNQLALYGRTSGTSNVTVCQNNSGQCGTLFVTVTGSVLGGSTYQNGQLLLEGSTIYITYKGRKSAFSNWNAFSGFGYKLSSVLSVGYLGLLDSGYVISTASASHPWGTWVKNGSTIYFVHDLGLIPVPDYGTFLNNGGQDNLVVPANSWDFQLPILSNMTSGDARLR